MTNTFLEDFRKEKERECLQKEAESMARRQSREYQRLFNELDTLECEYKQKSQALKNQMNSVLEEKVQEILPLLERIREIK